MATSGTTICATRHPRVKVLQPGPGVGGHCISVDPWFLVEAAPDLTPLVRTARQVNDAQSALQPADAHQPRADGNALPVARALDEPAEAHVVQHLHAQCLKTAQALIDFAADKVETAYTDKVASPWIGDLPEANGPAAKNIHDRQHYGFAERLDDQRRHQDHVVRCLRLCVAEGK